MCRIYIYTEKNREEKQMNVLVNMRHGLIVSCQALEDEPLHSPFIMSKMAKAAMIGGAVGIRANGYEDIKAIKSEVNIPIIGIIKKCYSGYIPYITPSIEEVRLVVEAGADIVAIDATVSLKPNDITNEELYKEIRRKYPNIIIMADISTFDEGIAAANLGFDVVSTTLSGYTEQSKVINEPDYELIYSLSKNIKTPLIAEGRIWSPEQAVKAMEVGAYSVVVGAAITRPQLITKRYTDLIAGWRNDAARK